jgi:MFS family permease
MTVVAPLSGRLTARYGARPAMIAGGLAVLASGVMLATLTPATPVPFLLTAYAIFGLGVALVNPPITSTAVSGMPAAQAGVASAVATTSRQVGITLGVAILGVVAGAGVVPVSGADSRTPPTPDGGSWPRSDSPSQPSATSRRPAGHSAPPIAAQNT